MNTTKRILVVDDNPDTARMMALLLKVEGYEARTCHDGLEALEAAREWRPDAVLLDLILPSMDGLTVAEELRDSPGLESVAIVAVTGHGPEQLTAAFDAHFQKPLDHDELCLYLSRLGQGVARSRVSDSEAMCSR